MHVNSRPPALIASQGALARRPRARAKSTSLSTAALMACLVVLCPAAVLAEPKAAFEARSTIAPPSGGATANFGGLSGIDYDPVHKLYVVISDDTSEHGPSRFYEAKISIARGRMTVTATRTLRNSANGDYAVKNSGGEQADGEAIRVDPSTGLRLWSSEGDIGRNFAPALRWADREGGFRGLYPLPQVLVTGVRPNLAYEGLTFTPAGDLWLGLEAPTVADGPLATAQAGARTRLTRLDRAGNIKRQVAYPLDPIRKATPGKNSDLGLSEILWLDENRLLVLERSGLQVAGTTYEFHCRLYLADLSKATDVTGVVRLSDADIRPAAKTLLIEFDDAPGPPVGNVEGMAWAPRGLFGARRLVFVTDNNFDPLSSNELLIYKFKK